MLMRGWVGEPLLGIRRFTDLDHYFGIDVVPELISENERKYRRNSKETFDILAHDYLYLSREEYLDQDERFAQPGR